MKNQNQISKNQVLVSGVVVLVGSLVLGLAGCNQPGALTQASSTNTQSGSGDRSPASAKDAATAIAEQKANYEKGLVALAEESQKAKPACDEFHGKLGEALKNVGQDGMLTGKDATIELAKLLGTYPGMPDATQRLILGAIFPPPGGEAWDFSPVLSGFTCPMGNFVAGYRVLVNNVVLHKITGKERAQIAELGVQAAQRELLKPVGPDGVTNGVILLNLLADERMINVDDAMYVKLMDLVDESREARTEIQKLSQDKVAWINTPNWKFTSLSASQKNDLRAVQQAEYQKFNDLAVKTFRVARRIASAPAN